MQTDQGDEIYRLQTASLYDAISMGMDGDVRFYTEEALRSGGPVLELGAGTGRILIPIAEAGVEIAGLDAAQPMLDIAASKVEALAESVRSRITLIRADMRSFSLNRRFNAVLIPFRAFLHMLTVEDQMRSLAAIHEHLADDGRLILNIFDARLDTIAAHSGPFGTAVKRLQETTHPVTGNRLVIWDSRRYDCEGQVLTEDRIMEEIDSDGLMLSRRYATLVLRYVFRYEMEHLLFRCGFEVEALYGDFARGAFHYGGEQVWVARRR